MRTIGSDQALEEVLNTINCNFWTRADHTITISGFNLVNNSQGLSCQTFANAPAHLLTCKENLKEDIRKLASLEKNGCGLQYGRTIWLVNKQWVKMQGITLNSSYFHVRGGTPSPHSSLPSAITVEELEKRLLLQQVENGSSVIASAGLEGSAGLTGDGLPRELTDSSGTLDVPSSQESSSPQSGAEEIARRLLHPTHYSFFPSQACKEPLDDSSLFAFSLFEEVELGKKEANKMR